MFHELPGPPPATRAVGHVAECNQAQRRMAELQLSPDRFLLDAGPAAGRLRRIPVPHLGPLVHEPSADKRFSGGHARR